MQDIQIGVIGLGYVGLPLAVAFSRHFEVVGYDADSIRIAELSEGKTGQRKLSWLLTK